MSEEMVDGIKVLKLKDNILDGDIGAHTDDTLTMLRLWQLLSGGEALKDSAVFERRVL